MLNHLQSELAIKEKKLSTQTENMERGLAERDIVISQQAELFNKLQEDLVEVGPRTMTAARAEIETHFQRHMADRESEFATLVQNHETLQKNFEAMEQLVESSPTRLSSDQGPSSPRRHQSSSARVTLVGKYVDNNMTPQTAQTPQTPLPSGVPAFSPSAASSPIEVNAGMIVQQVYNLINQNHFSEPPPSPTPRSLPKKRSSSVQQTKLEISNDKERSENLAHVRDLFDNVFSISKDEEVLLVEGASREEVKAYSQNGQGGPQQWDLHWDFHGSASSDWNKIVVSYLSNPYWANTISQKLSHLRSVYLKAKPRVCDNNSIETEVEAAERLVREKEESLKKARMDSRRAAKFKRRHGVVQGMAGFNTEQGKMEEVRTWEFLRDVVAMLGTDGMSSDDSGDEDMAPVFCTRAMPWRKNIQHELDIIDRSRALDSDIFSPRGAKVTKRIRVHHPVLMSRNPVKNLPASFYDTKWLGQQKGVASEIDFPWMTILIHQS
ncbi:hypothetical protein PAXINDRAFT_17207 [Paxillus involutus ATCC 200175]|uniref:Unplaced genomic scaffold PAXINscaffold_118, whole genome shotgun sequence n=1 Tax=Paxillus involutus ATCC 200175 TaxID=664439 RepID=A0A0C9TRE7_PAXIN|nr:hypothetical protein PAXINDRAFT_17207 [Paxillus involutus ATCC 200175]